MLAFEAEQQPNMAAAPAGSESPVPVSDVEHEPFTVLIMCADDESKAAKKWRRYVTYPVPDNVRVLYVGEKITQSEDSFHMSARDYAANPTTPAADLIFFEFCPMGAERLPDSMMTFRQEMGDLVDKKLNDDGKIVLPHKMIYYMAKRLNMISTKYPHTFKRSQHVIL